MLILRAAFSWTLLSILALLTASSGAHDSPRSEGVSRAQRSGNGPIRGRFTLKNGMQCIWATKDTRNGVKMLVKCENSEARISGGVTDVQCEYNAKPQSCPAYQSNPKAYYKQVFRALKKLQGALCKEERVLIKAGMCKRASRDAHFKLDMNSAVTSAQSGIDPTPHPKSSSTTTSTTTTTTTTTPTAHVPSGTPTDCKRRADHREVAKEYCNSSWASVCAFFFSMLQTEEC
ncbi:hypothetical protein NL108_009340 [Boleophthalmus pectinirostris]|uniref:fibroblast growth factor-binding protein 1 n=1 Tax=Boleophthalmus pectinirostris TaxID=150288 RepID=UPI00242E2480|nr:fibroblast growth factor-binding protein 1 [Boleophthalmus pectinirostris]KAJ0050886.1 hypothetical protein NL108_009340 [Boleophthalmus pectinirostris]